MPEIVVVICTFARIDKKMSWLNISVWFADTLVFCCNFLFFRVTLLGSYNKIGLIRRWIFVLLVVDTFLNSIIFILSVCIGYQYDMVLAANFVFGRAYFIHE